MQIDIIDDFRAFQLIKENWERVYAADIKGQFFLSWAWLAGVLKRCDEHDEKWFILAAKLNESASEYVAFFPLIILTRSYLDGELYNEILMAGVTDAVCIGFICLPEYEETVSAAFATSLQQEEWTVLQIQNIPKSDIRLSQFLRGFKDFELQKTRLINDVDHIDYNNCPYLTLPTDWEQYLQNFLGASTRKQIRRLFRKVEDSNEFHLTYVNADNLEQHLGILLNFWKANWEGRKGADECQRILERCNFFLRHCFEHQCLYFPVLWRKDKPIGAQASFVDPIHKTMLCFIGSRDEAVQEPPPGIFLHVHSIRYAIQNGFKVYDFLMGNESYKFSLGAKECHIETAVVRRKNLTNQIQKLNVRTIPQALQISAYYHRTNHLAEAERGYRQILDVQPQHLEALYGLSVVMQRREDYPLAEKLLKKFLQIQPKNVKAWFSLANLHQIQGQLPDAENAYRQALTLQPESLAISLAIYHNLGYTLQQQDNWDEAITCYQKARELQPNSVEAEVIWANALYAQGKLSVADQARYAAMNYELGNKREQAGDFKTAIEYYRQAIAMDSSLVEAHYHLGLMLQTQGNWDEAITCYQTTQTLQPGHEEAEVRLANALYAQGKLSVADQARYAAMNYELGNKHKQAGDSKTAIEYYWQAIRLNPDLAEVRDYLRLALEEQENTKIKVSCAKS